MVGTRGLAEVRQYVRAAFESYGYDVHTQPFRVSRLPIPFVTLVLIACVLATLVLANVWYPSWPGASLLVVLGCLALVMSMAWWPRAAERLLDLPCQVEGENLMARLGPASADPPRLIVMAHYDSKSEVFSTRTRVLAAMVVLAGLLGLAGLCAWSLVFPDRAVPAVTIMWVSVVPGLVAVTFAFQRTQNRGPGADDNASGVAVMLELARDLAHTPDLAARILWVATDAEEIGLGGAVRLVQQFGPEWPAAQVGVINFDSVGTGPRLLVAGPRRSRLKRLCHQRAPDLDVLLRTMLPIPGVALDHQPLARRGYDAVSLLGNVAGPTSRRLHTPRDVVHYVEIASLDRCWRLSADVIRAWLDRDDPAASVGGLPP